jgi:glucokinase
MLAEKSAGDPNVIDAKFVIDCAKAGDNTAKEVFDTYVDHLGAACIAAVHILDPQVIAIGGGVSHAGEFLLNKINEMLPGMIFCKNMPYARIELARMGNDAGIIGAAMLGTQED